MPPPPRKQKVGDFPGSNAEEIENEPDYGIGSHKHRIGFRNTQVGLLGGLRCHHTLEVVLNQVDRLFSRKKNCAWRPPCEIRYCQGWKRFMRGTLDESIKRVNWDIRIAGL